MVIAQTTPRKCVLKRYHREYHKRGALQRQPDKQSIYQRYDSVSKSVPNYLQNSREKLPHYKFGIPPIEVVFYLWIQPFEMVQIPIPRFVRSIIGDYYILTMKSVHYLIYDYHRWVVYTEVLHPSAQIHIQRKIIISQFFY